MYVIGCAGQARFGKDVVSNRLCSKLNEQHNNSVQNFITYYAEKRMVEGYALSIEDYQKTNNIFFPIMHNAMWNYNPWARTAFAANVKKVYCETFNVSLEFVEQWKDNPNPPPGFEMNVRQSLQFIGDGFRKIQGSIWLDLVFRDDKPKIISDVRYINEFLRVKEEGGLNILLGRPEKLNDDPNGSEAQIRPYIDWCLKKFSSKDKFWDLRDSRMYDAPPNMDKFDVFILNDGSLEDLYHIVDTKLVEFVKEFKFQKVD